MKTLTVNGFIVLKLLQRSEYTTKGISRVMKLNINVVNGILRGLRNRKLILAKEISECVFIQNIVTSDYFRESNLNIYSITDLGEKMVNNYSEILKYVAS